MASASWLGSPKYVTRFSERSEKEFKDKEGTQTGAGLLMQSKSAPFR
jgi:hypothetical protein